MTERERENVFVHLLYTHFFSSFIFFILSVALWCVRYTYIHTNTHNFQPEQIERPLQAKNHSFLLLSNGIVQFEWDEYKNVFSAWFKFSNDRKAKKKKKKMNGTNKVWKDKKKMKMKKVTQLAKKFNYFLMWIGSKMTLEMTKHKYFVLPLFHIFHAFLSMLHSSMKRKISINLAATKRKKKKKHCSFAIL